MTDIVLVDFAGTLIRTAIIDEANEKRSKFLKRAIPTPQEHANPQELYAQNRDLVEQLTGLPADAHVLTRTDTLEDTTLSGKQVQNAISTTLFQIGMYAAANKHKKDIVVDGMLEELRRIKDAGYELAICSGVRTDIISGMLAIADIDVFDHILGQPAVLGISNEAQYRELASRGNVRFVIGDKTSDLAPASKLGAQVVWVPWGYPQGDEQEHADFVAETPQDLQRIIR